MSNLFCKIIIHSFLERFILIYAILIPVVATLRTSAALISLVLVVHELSKLLFDNISGSLADKYGRLLVMKFGLFLKFIGITLWIIDYNLISLMIGIAAIGCGRSCLFSKIDAYLYDELQVKNSVTRFSSFLMVRTVAANSGAIIGGFLVSWLLIYGFKAIFLVAVLVIATHLLFLHFSLEENHAIGVKNSIGIRQVIAISLQTVLQDRTLRFCIVMVAALNTAFIVLLDLHKMILNDLAVAPTVAARIYSLVHAVPLITGLMALWKSKFNNLNTFIAMLLTFLCFSAVLLGVMIYNATFVSVGMLIYFALFPILDVSFKVILEKRYVGPMRATISSFASFVSSVGNVISMLYIGIIGHFISYYYAAMSLIMIFLIAIVVIFAIMASNNYFQER